MIALGIGGLRRLTTRLVNVDAGTLTNHAVCLPAIGTGVSLKRFTTTTAARYYAFLSVRVGGAGGVMARILVRQQYYRFEDDCRCATTNPRHDSTL